MTLEDYLSLFPGSTREKSRFMAVASAVLQQIVDLQAVVGELNAAFSPDSAQGAQLDALGESLGLSRLDTTAGAAATDEVYRDFIRKKLIRWGWDGTNKSVPGIAEQLQAGSVEKDNLNGTVTITGAGTQPAAVKELYPIPAGIRTTE
jgi:hypothetical protein